MKYLIKSNFEIILISFLIVFAVLSRLIPHPPNFTPIGGIAIFGAIKITNKYIAVLLPLICMFISDLYLGFTLVSLFVYFSFFLISLISIHIKTNTINKVFLSSFIFFFITNFGVWLIGYPLTLEGFSACYLLAIPFYINTILGDFFYTFSLIFFYNISVNYFMVRYRK